MREMLRMGSIRNILSLRYTKNIFPFPDEKKNSWTLRKEKARQEQEAIYQAEAERILREEIIKNNTEIVSAHNAAQNAFHESHAGVHLIQITEIIFKKTDSQLSVFQNF